MESIADIRDSPSIFAETPTLAIQDSHNSPRSQAYYSLGRGRIGLWREREREEEKTE
jgi:hypothetical protein